MRVTELTRDQLDELKQDFLCENEGSVSYGELSEATDIPDEVIFKHFAGVDFKPDDFFCSRS